MALTPDGTPGPHPVVVVTHGFGAVKEQYTCSGSSYSGFEADRLARFGGEPPAMIPLITATPGEPAALAAPARS